MAIKLFPCGCGDGLIARLDKLSEQTNRSRNELINLLLEAAIDIVKVEE